MAQPATTQTGRPSAGLLERARELAALGEALDAVRRTGEGRLVFVSGEAGVGKTALMRDFRHLAERSARILWGGCDPLFTPSPLGPLLTIADSIGGELQELIHAAVLPHKVVAALAQECHGGTTVFVLEDVHWADEATLDVLRLLARRLDTAPALIVATFRDDELDLKHPMRIMLGELATNRAVSRLKLAPLSRDGVAQLASPHGVDAGTLYERTGGNPFFVVEVLSSPSQEIPESVRDAILARAARLTPAARGVLEAASIVPQHAEIWLLKAMVGEAIGALDECLSSGLLLSESGAVAFRHELARLAVGDAIAPDRLLELHQRALAALSSPPDGSLDHARLAHHAEAAGDRDAVLRYAIPAGEYAAVRSAHREAAAQYARALHFSAGLPPAERVDLLQRRSRSTLLTDQYDEGIADLQEAVGICHAIGDPLLEGDSLRRLSQFLWCPGRIVECERSAVESVRLLEGLEPGIALAKAYCNLSFVRHKSARVDESLAFAQRALRLAERLGDEETAIDVSARIALCERDDAQLVEVLERALRVDLAVVDVYVPVAEVAIQGRRLSETLHYIEDGLAYGSSRGNELDRLYLLAYRAHHELARGAWSEAAETAASVIRIPRTSTTPRILSLVALSLVRARRGDPGYDEALDEAWALAEPTGELPRIGPVAAARAEVAWLRGDAAAVDRATRDALRLAIDRRAGWHMGRLAAIRLRAGLDAGLTADVAVDAPYSLQIAGDPRGAAAMWRELGWTYEAALALIDAGDESSLRQALDELQRLDARATAAIASRRLRELGVRAIPRGPRASTMQNPANLTEREIDVLRLVWAGHRNSEIAARLVVSERTVDHHVSAILSKLGVRTRMEAAALAAREGLTDSTN